MHYTPIMKTLLIPIDYSEKSLKALEVAFNLASQIQGQLLLCHVYQPPVLLSGEHEPVFALPEYETKKQALRKLRIFTYLAKTNAQCKVPIKFTVKAGSVVEGILELVKSRAVSMVIMGTRGKSSILAKAFGTKTEELVQHAPCPVLIVPESAEISSISKIVYASALRPDEAAALRVLTQMKKLFHASLILLYIDRNGEQGQLNIAVRKNYLLHEFSDGEVEFVSVKNSSVAEGIAQYVKDANCDLLAFTVSDHEPWTALIHSSIIKQLLLKVNLPLLALSKHGKEMNLEQVEVRQTLE